jgi:hypothetical protein
MFRKPLSDFTAATSVLPFYCDDSDHRASQELLCVALRLAKDTYYSALVNRRRCGPHHLDHSSSK